MFSYLYSLITGGCTDNGWTHLLHIKSDSSMKVRIYISETNFYTIDLRDLYIKYNRVTQKVRSKNYTPFEVLDMNEFLHLVIPNENYDIFRIPERETWQASGMYDEMSTYTSKEDYMCTCSKTSSEECLFHKFIMENLYIKYKITEDSDQCYEYYRFYN